ncbi:MAG: arginase [Geminicoccaceae bacterium]|nr:MAG: arginase [Geminicoccaceae bacterium]
MTEARPGTFCGVPFIAELRLGVAEAIVIGAPHGTPYAGQAPHATRAPTAIRAATDWYCSGPDQFDFDSETIRFAGARVADAGDLQSSPTDGAANRATIAAAVRFILAAGAVPVVLGGDDSVPIPVLEAYAGQKLTVVQIDAHIDWRDEVKGERFGFSSTMRRASEMPHVEALVQVGARGPGSARPAEVEAARAWGAELVTARELHRRGVSTVLDRIPHRRPVYLAIDVDGLDPALVPGVLLPAFGGVTYTQMLDLIHGLEAHAPIAGVSFVEYVPEKDPTRIGAMAIARLACNVIAAIGRQRATA